MFGFKNKRKEEATRTIPKPISNWKKLTTNELVQEIHETFYTEVDRLLANAKILKSTESQLEDLIKKSDKLKSLGFVNTKECKDAQVEIDRLNIIKAENQFKNDLNEAINYFTQKYPLNKFITEDSVKKICEKYNLVYGTIDRYLGTVPDKNLKEIANFKDVVKEEDCQWGEKRAWRNSFDIIRQSDYQYYKRKALEEEKAYTQALMNNDMSAYYQIYGGNTSYRYRLCNIIKAPLEIAAPIKDFNLEGMELKDRKLSKIEIPDPVVLHPVEYKNTKYYLIVSAWGEEASDELVKNNIYN